MTNKSVKYFLKAYIHLPLLKFKERILGTIYRHDPERRANALFKKEYGRCINWENPTEFIEKIRVLQFRSDITLWPRLADKIEARSYIEQIGLGHLLTKIYGTWNNVNEIDFNIIPNQFVIKLNNGSGDAIIVTDKHRCNLQSIRRKLANEMRHVYGGYRAETQYFNIKPQILAEELLPNDSPNSSCIIDYKFFCIYGEPHICIAYYDRNNGKLHTMRKSAYDTSWIKRDEWLRLNNHATAKDMPRPALFNDMLKYCRQLSKGLPFVRVDLYQAHNKVYFGEYTFTPAGLKREMLSDTAYDYLSSKL
jgi:hypothetical protein